jgi:hypothetical protein
MIPVLWIGSRSGESANLDTAGPQASFAAEAVLAEQESTPVVPPAPSTFDLGKPVADLDGGNEPVTWAGGTLELTEAQHRPASALRSDPVSHKWMTWAIGGSLGLVAILAFALTRGGDAEAGEGDEDSQADVEIPSAPPEPELEAAPPPAPEPPPAKKSSKKASRTAATSSTKSDSTFAASSEQASEPSTSKPAASKPAASKPAASKPAGTSTPSAPAKSDPTPAPSKPAGNPLAPPDDEGSGSKAELPDVSGWDDQDAALGDRSAEGL